MTVTAVLTLLAGIGVFLTACGMMSSNLESLGSSKLRDLFAQTVSAYDSEDEGEVVKAGVTNLAITEQVSQMTANHVMRISMGKCSPDAGFTYLGLVSDVEHIGGHYYNVAKTVRHS